MEVNNQSKLTRIAIKKLSDLKKQSIEPLRDLLLNYVEHRKNKLKPNDQLKLIKEITNYEHLETKYITPLRFIKTKNHYL